MTFDDWPLRARKDGSAPVSALLAMDKYVSRDSCGMFGMGPVSPTPLKLIDCRFVSEASAVGIRVP